MSYSQSSFYVGFSALRGMPARTSDEKGVCPFVCPSVCQTRGLWQNGRKICPYFYTIRKIKGAQKRKTAVFGVKSHFAWRKSAIVFLC